MTDSREARVRLPDAQLEALRTVQMWSKEGTYMPSLREERTFKACERKGLLEYRSVDEGSRYNGYALTPAGRRAMENSHED